MLKKSVDNLSIIGFMLLLFLLLLSALGLYINHYGLSIEKLYLYYAGDADHYINPKSFNTIIKTFSPHILVMPLSFFILFHIGMASKSFKPHQVKYIAMIGFGSAIMDIVINFLIALSPVMAFIKILTLLLFELTMIYVMLQIYKKIYKK
jgi:hypothetical protein